VIAAGPAGTRMRLHLGDEIDAQVFLFGDYDPASRRVMETVLQPGDTAVDAGANIGFFTLVLARAVGPAGTVVAFEPAPDTFDRLLRNLDLNGCTQVRALAVALGAAAGEASLVRDSPSRSGDSRITAGGGGVRVPVTRLDEAIGDGRPRLLKIDVEGQELEVLRGAAGTLRSAAPVLLVEANVHTSPAGDGPARLVQWLAAEHGYRCFSIEPGGLAPFAAGSVVNGNLVALAPADLKLEPALSAAVAGAVGARFEVWPAPARRS